MSDHCSDLEGDRALGAQWERMFCAMAADKGKLFTPHQIGRPKSACAYYGKQWHQLTLPDITIWTRPGEHHEIKHKAPTRDGYLGLEHYRIKALKWFAEHTGQGVYYTIHNHNGDRNSTLHREQDWITANAAMLWLATQDGRAMARKWKSWVGGEPRIVPGWFWPISLFRPLVELWAPPPEPLPKELKGLPLFERGWS